MSKRPKVLVKDLTRYKFHPYYTKKLQTMSSTQFNRDTKKIPFIINEKLRYY